MVGRVTLSLTVMEKTEGGGGFMRNIRSFVLEMLSLRVNYIFKKGYQLVTWIYETRGHLRCWKWIKFGSH